MQYHSDLIMKRIYIIDRPPNMFALWYWCRQACSTASLQ